MSQYEPLKITAALAEPVIIDRQQPLDGILGAITIQDPDFRQRDREFRRFRRNAEKHGFDNAKEWWKKNGWPIPTNPHFVPLAVYGHGKEHGLWVYCSSWAIPGDSEKGRTYFNKRLDFLQLSDWIEPSRKRIETGKGEFKSEHIPFVYTATDSLTWFVNGDKSTIEEMLTITFSIAKKRHRGYGSVPEWHIEPMADDCSVWRGNELMRPIPLDLLDLMGIRGDFELGFTTYRPPYWDGRYVSECAVKGQKAA